MDERVRVQDAIRAIAGRRKNVTLNEIDWVVNQLELYHPVVRKENEHGVRYRIGGARFGVCTHHRGNKQLKRCYVDDFISAMIELGWFDETEEENERP
jgi:hypothetical protein